MPVSSNHELSRVSSAWTTQPMKEVTGQIVVSDTEVWLTMEADCRSSLRSFVTLLYVMVHRTAAMAQHATNDWYLHWI